MQADIIFVTGVYPDRLPAALKGDGGQKVNTLGGLNVWVIGSKWFGVSNGMFYSRRFGERYWEQRQTIPESVRADIAKESELYGSRFIDIMRAFSADGKTVPVFTDDHKIISQDCKHLTKGGASFAARRLDLDPCFYDLVIMHGGGHE